MIVVIEYDGQDITKDVVITDSVFMSAANGEPGSCHLRVKDLRTDDTPYGPSYFIVGKKLTLRMNGDNQWGGFVNTVTSQYSFPVVETDNPDIRERFWVIDGVDFNILFTRRFLFNQTDPLADMKTYPTNTPDTTILADLITNYLDLSGDAIDTSSGIVHVGNPGQFEPVRVAAVGDAWGIALGHMAENLGAIFYIDPDSVFHWCDDETVTAPFPLSDQPGETGVGFRDMEILSSASDMANDALLWGAGLGESHVKFSRHTDAASIAEHGRWQWAEFRQDLYVQLEMDRITASYVDGSPQHHRGHKDDHDFIRVSTFYPGYRVGQVVDFESVAFGYTDSVPIRRVTITFVTGDPSNGEFGAEFGYLGNARFDLELSHELDVGLAFADFPPYPNPHFPLTVTETIPLDLFPDLGPPLLISGDVSKSLTLNQLSGARQLAGVDAGVPFSNNDTIIQPFTDRGAVSSIGYNIAYTQLGFRCTYADGSPVGPGGWGPAKDDEEAWYNLFFTDIDTQLAGRSIILHLSTLVVNGFAQGMKIGYSALQAAGPSPSDYKQWAELAEVPCRAVYPDGINDGRFEDFGLLEIPANQFINGENWIILAPMWSADSLFFCDIDYSEPGSPYAANGPVVTGQGNSGRVITSPRLTFDMVPPSFLTQVPEANVLMDGPTPSQTPYVVYSEPGKYWTHYPYVPGSLQVLLNGTPARRNEEFFETNPAKGEFQISIPQDMTLTGSIMVTYTRADVFGNDPFTGNLPPPPGDQTPGNVYRPAFVSQLGWGFADDGIDCVAASGCALLDRTTLGAKTDTPHFLRAAVNPPDFVEGLTFTQIAQAIQDKWGESLFFSGPISYEGFCRYLDEGRGALCTGDSTALLPYNLEARSEYTGQPFVGPHSIYINERRADGYLYCYDPAFHPNSKYHITPGWYPPDAIRAYFAATSGSVDRTEALFSTRTGKL